MTAPIQDETARALLQIAEAIDLGEEHPLFWVSTAIRAVFSSPNEMDRNFEPANVVDGLFAIGRALYDVADAIREHGGQARKERPDGLRPIEARVRVAR